MIMFHIKKKSALLILVIMFNTTLIFCVLTGSAHDFSSHGWNSGGEICQPCHTPHLSGVDSVPANIAPLWNHQVTEVATFSVYTGYDMQVTPGQPEGISLLCLSCHDGTIALDAFGENTTGSDYMTGNALLGTNLSNDHPISIDWQHQTNDGGGSLWCVNCHNMHATPTYISELVFFNGKVECPTCHDVHNTAGIDKLLRITSLNSEICLSCHNK